MKTVEGMWVKHKHGNIYKVMYIARNSETLEEVVVYGDDFHRWVRPREMFEDGRFEEVPTPDWAVTP